jgi:hypothetical protein
MCSIGYAASKRGGGQYWPPHRGVRPIRMGSMTTGRYVLLTSFTLCAVLGATQEFWDQKDPKDWSADEVKALLSLSPWAKPASISFFNNSPGGDYGLAGGRAGAGLNQQRVSSRQRSANGTIPDPASNPGTFRAVVRWETARPVQVAEKNRPEDGDSRFYILSLNGDLPDFARPNDEESAEARQQRVEMLRESTRLDRKSGSPIYLERLEPSATGTLFYFSRLDPITPANKEITFSTKMGPLDIKVKFLLKDMMYKGKLEL